MLARCIANDYGRLGVRANAVCPGWVRTLMIDRFDFAVLPLLDSFVLTQHFRKLLVGRNDLIKRAAEDSAARYEVGDSRA
jgi:meso-butanediol dehydrogenase/(S,S)-butanediol dehydrogenase/diacetyl reductase